ncbi:hypothetical protein WA026_013479 [Henosepilachna vigintioctopunctata]|uniref:Uncharacterized protein n=1 Tax=Henosepilachna vigintioctopunctata TaxID=420089 RepID=A0AAW1V653_9CUCU
MIPATKMLFASIFVLQMSQKLSLQYGLTEGAPGNGHLIGGISVGSNISGSGSLIGEIVDGVKGTAGGLVNAAGQVIGDIRKETGEGIDNAENGAGNIIEDIGKGTGRLIHDFGDAEKDIHHGSWNIGHGVNHKNDHNDHGGHASSSHSSGKANSEKHHGENHKDHHGAWQHDGKSKNTFWWVKTGRGIDWLSGIGSMGGIRTPIYDLLGLTKSICRVSFVAEDLIENLGEFHMRVDRKIDEIDRSVVDYVTDKIIKRAVDVVRRNHIAFVAFLVDAHIGLDRFIYNSIIEAYRITKSPVRELFACH